MSVTILTGDCRDVLRTLPDCSVHCCVTSPPYWGLRDYGVAGQIGLEEIPQQFVAEIVELFREVRRVLRDDGTCWFNMGDSYAGSGRGGNLSADSSTLQGLLASQEASMIKRARKATEIGGSAREAAVTNIGCRATRGSQLPAGFHENAVENGAIGRAWVPAPFGLKQKDLIGMPWRCAFALQADGWYLRQDIIWAKPNPMPESVTDRCTKAHEYIFLLSKSARYYYDADAIAEPRTQDEDAATFRGGCYIGGETDNAIMGKRRVSANKTHKMAISDVGYPKRNKRSVWTVATSPFAEAHFATFPPALIEPCILAACPIGGTVLDPFGGAGTTGLVADRLQRSAILIELNPEYVAMQRKRIAGDAGMFASVTG